jgi:hypothetical protein
VVIDRQIVDGVEDDVLSSISGGKMRGLM